MERKPRQAAVGEVPEPAGGAGSLSVKDRIEIIQSLATIVALVIGGIWALKLYVEQREAVPWLNIDHKVKSVLLDKDHRLIHLTVVHENRGKTLVKLVDEDIRLQRILPLHDGVARALERDGKMVRDGEQAVRWPLLQRRVLQRPTELEPNETNEAVNEFVIPAELKVIKIYSYYRNALKRDIGWSKSTIYTIGEKGKAIGPAS